MLKQLGRVLVTVAFATLSVQALEAGSFEMLAGRVTIDTPGPTTVTVTVDETDRTVSVNRPPSTVVLSYHTSTPVDPVYGTLANATVVYTSYAIIVMSVELPKAYVFSLSTRPENDDFVRPDDVVHFNGGAAISLSRHSLGADPERRPVRRADRFNPTTNGPCTLSPTGGCDNGGYNATECTVTIGPASCSVSCAEGYYACCNFMGEPELGTVEGCHCYPNPTDEACSGGGGGGGW
jgi:hypothetical protein